MSGSLIKFTSRSEEYNPLNVVRLGTGRSSTVYAFDYSYCVANQIPTHYVLGTEKIDRSRSISTGRWVSRVTHLSDEILDHTSITAKIDGEIYWVHSKDGDKSGFVKGDDGEEYYFRKSNIIDEDRSKRLVQGRRVRFIPHLYADTRFAQGIELL